MQCGAQDEKLARDDKVSYRKWAKIKLVLIQRKLQVCFVFLRVTRGAPSSLALKFLQGFFDHTACPYLLNLLLHSGPLELDKGVQLPSAAFPNLM